VVGCPFDEATLVRVGAAFREATGYTRAPALRGPRGRRWMYGERPCAEPREPL